MDFINSIYEYATNWPPLDQYTAISLLLGSLALSLNIYMINRATKNGEKRQADALFELKRRILNNASNTKLLNANYLRSLAITCERLYNCPVITDKLIVEAIRDAAWDIENHFKGAALLRCLERLNAIISELDSQSPPLLSLAGLDRLLAYKKSQLVLAVLIYVCTIVSLGMIKSPWTMSHLILLSSLILTQCLLAMSALRISIYWSSKCGKQTSLLNRLFRPASSGPSIVIDFFLHTLVSRNRWVDVFLNKVWAPIWEMPLTILHRPGRFSIMHEFRYGKAKKLSRELLGIQRSFDVCKANGATPDSKKQQRFADLCQQLYRLTGDRYFREAKQTGQIPPVDKAGSLTRHIF